MRARKKRPLPTQDEVLSSLLYDRDTGVFTWLRSCRPRFNGRVAGSVDTQGYVIISLGGKQYAAHRLAWLYVTGEWPANDIDHINRVRDDNRFENLRAVPRRANLQNQSLRQSNTTGVSGVYFNARHDNWYVQIGAGGKRHCFGHFKTFEQAVAVRNAAKAKLHPFDPRFFGGGVGRHAESVGANPDAAPCLSVGGPVGGYGCAGVQMERA